MNTDDVSAKIRTKDLKAQGKITYFIIRLVIANIELFVRSFTASEEAEIASFIGTKTFSQLNMISKGIMKI
jgi:hypothetical protein